MNEIRVEHGAPNDEELAAAIAVVTAALAQAQQEADSETGATISTWNRNRGMLRSPLTAGEGQWQASFRNGLR